jgi:hypothetical protein
MAYCQTHCGWEKGSNMDVEQDIMRDGEREEQEEEKKKKNPPLLHTSAGITSDTYNLEYPTTCCIYGHIITLEGIVVYKIYLIGYI